MNPPRPPIPDQLAMPVKVFAWVMLVILAVPSVAIGLLLLSLMSSADDPTSDPHGYAAVFSVLGLFLVGIPLVAMILIVIGLYRNIRAAYGALIVVGVLAGLVLAGSITAQVASGRTLGFTGGLGLGWMALNFYGAFLAYRALKAQPAMPGYPAPAIPQQPSHPMPHHNPYPPPPQTFSQDPAAPPAQRPDGYR